MGKSSSVVVGYKYFLGLHFGVCYGPVDALKKILVGERQAWAGNVTDNEQISIEADDLFGGDKREGGIEGDLDVMMGGSAQTQNDYLLDKIEGLMPAFRGILSLVFRGGQVCANNPYIKPWAFQVQRILSGWDGGTAWYPEKAIAGSLTCTGPLAIYFVVDFSGSMTELASNGFTKYANQKTAMFAVLDYLEDLINDGSLPGLDVMIVGFGSYPDVRDTITERDVDSAAIANLKAFFPGSSPSYETFFPAATLDVADFFDGSPDEYKRLVFFITDGEPGTFEPGYTSQSMAEIASEALFEVEDVISYGVNIDETTTTYTAYMDNTPSDGVPVVDSGDPDALTNIITSQIGGYKGMNPAHIVYQCLTDPMWGMGYPVAQIDSASFEAAADTFFDEDFGLCLLWNQQSSIEDFVQQVIDHAGAVYYADPKTGLFKLKALRADYVAASLPIYDEDSIISVDNFQRVGYGDTVNEITVVYRDQCTNKDVPITVQDLANIQAQGMVVSQTKQYPGIPNGELAARVAERDLIAASTPLAKCRITVNRKAWAQAPGDVIKVSWDKLGLEEVIFRVLTINYGTLTQGQLVIELAEDVYGLPSSSYSEQEPGGFTEPDIMPSRITIQDLIESPYWDVARGASPAEMTFLDADSAFIMAVASSENGIDLGFEMWSRISPAEYVNSGASGSFSPTAVLTSDGLQPSDVVFEYEGGINIDRVEVGQRAIIGTGRDAEFVEIVAVDSMGGFEVNRGILDTVPQTHAPGTRIFFNESDFAVDQTERATGESVDVKLTTFAGGGETQVSASIEMTIVPDQRLYRPYPAGKVRINGEDFPDEVDSDVTLTWAHRDRLQQLAAYVSQDENSIGPEAGTTYTAEFFLNDVSVNSQTGLTGTMAVYSYAAGGVGRIELTSIRDSVENWQTQIREFVVLEPTTDAYIGDVVVLMHFDGSDASTTIVDVSEHVWGQYGNVQLDTAQSQFGGASLLLDGAGDYLTSVAVIPLTGPFTVECWFNHNNAGAFESIWTQKTSGTVNGRIMLSVRDTNLLNLFVGSGTSLNINGVTTVTSGWHHVAVTRDVSNVFRVFLDGNLEVSGSTSQALENAMMHIGRDPNDTTRDWDGWIDELRVTAGVTRYVGGFTVPINPFDDVDINPVYYSGTTSLLHFNGADASTTFTDVLGLTWTVNGNAQIDTAQSQFGGASGLFDGTGDYITTPDAASWEPGASPFTLECWVRPAAFGAAMSIFQKRATSATFGGFNLYLDAAGKPGALATFNGTTWGVNILSGSAISTGVWTHLAFVRDGNLWSIYVNGVSVASTTVSGTVQNNATTPSIGAIADASLPYNGHIDEFRFINGLAIYTGNFTVPTAPFADASS